jgi:hypothetical protein
MAGPPYNHDVPFVVDYSTLNSFDPAFGRRPIPNAAYSNSNTAGPTHATAAPSFQGFRDALALNSPTLRGKAPLAWISEAPSAYGRNALGYGPIGVLER